MQILDILSIGFFLSLLFDNQFLAEYWRPIFQVGRFLALYTILGTFFLFAAFPYISKIHLCFNKDHQENGLQPVSKKRAKLLNLQEKD
jgi:hypothetical protein